MTEKKKISAFEYVIMQAADPDKAKEYEPKTREEELKERIDKLKDTAKKLKIRHEE